MSQEGKSILESTLGKLLGFDDGAGDVLDHLLTIESKEDLAEYLSQLLGNETSEIIEFVQNVGRFQRGEEVILTSTDDGTQTTDDSKPSAKAPSLAASELPPQKQTNKNSNNSNNNKNTGALQGLRNQKQVKGRVPPPSRKATKANNTSQISDCKSAAMELKTQSTEVSHSSKPETQQKVEKSRPSRGKATIVCGCFGTKHKALTNCLYCGRISCVEEGYDFCPFCGYCIEEIKDESHNNEASWVQKERLLRFDRDFARRTQIFDDQADFQAPATWMTEEERAQAEEKQNDRIESLKRPKQTLSLSI